MTKPNHAWMVRAGNDNELADLVDAKGALAIGWSLMGDLSPLKTRANSGGATRRSTPTIPRIAQRSIQVKFSDLQSRCIRGTMF